MNNIFKFITVVAFVVAVLALILAIPSSGLGGITNYDSLHLRSAVPSDNALEVEDSSGTDQLVIYGSGGLTIGGTSTFSGAGVFSDTLDVDGVTTLGDTVGITGAATLDSTLTVSGESQLDSLIQGGTVLTLATITPPILSATNVCDNSIIIQQDWDGRASSTDTLTLPTVTALYALCLDTQGDMKTILFRNTASTEASTTVITAGTNIVISTSTGSTVTVPGGGSAKIEFWRVGATATSSGIQANVTLQSL